MDFISHPALPKRPWLPEPAQRFIAEQEARYAALSLPELEAELLDLVNAQQHHLDRDCIMLYAGTNVPNPRAAALLASDIGNRPNLGYPGAKYNLGMRQAEQLEVMLGLLLRRLFRADFAEHRLASGSMANLCAFMATAQPGEVAMVFDESAAGHATHQSYGAAGLYGLRVHPIPFDAERMDVDVPKLREQAHHLRPRLIVLAGSMCLFPYSVADVRAIADEVGAWVIYDAAHMSGLIAGGAFQQALHEGAHVMTSSTYKSFGGVPGGFVLTNEPALAQRIEAVAYPGLSANFDLGRTAALCLAALDLLAHGEEYAATVIANAQALAEALAERDVPVFRAAGRGHPFTQSQHVAIRAAPFGGGNRASARLAEANVIASSVGLPEAPIPGDANGIRLGTQEVTRWGMRPEHMPTIAEFIARVLMRGEPPARVRADVLDFRRKFTHLHFIREG
ncbi:MAG: aminotransferase class I/II-fold pyridoxal phosphate-dependent enzyme [Thermoflexales bacterium]